LLDGLCIGKNLHFVLGEFSGDAWYLCWTPGKHPPVLTEELDESAFLYGGERIQLPRGLGTSREKPTASAPKLLIPGELQLASDTNAGGNYYPWRIVFFAGGNVVYCW
jgi:hypothetical protein